ncbi:hypothetical protein DB29_02954 [Shouchella clausii]|nr:hypothetical protein DB29_02954 [Shouchella clausii]
MKKMNHCVYSQAIAVNKERGRAILIITNEHVLESLFLSFII